MAAISQSLVKKIGVRSVALGRTPDGDMPVDFKQADAEYQWSHVKLQILTLTTEEKHLVAGEDDTIQKSMADTGNALIEPKISIAGGAPLEMTVGVHNGKPVMECIFPILGQTFPIMATLTTKYTSKVNRKEWEISGHPFKITSPELIAAACCVIA